MSSSIDLRYSTSLKKKQIDLVILSIHQVNSNKATIKHKPIWLNFDILFIFFCNCDERVLVVLNCEYVINENKR